MTRRALIAGAARNGFDDMSRIPPVARLVVVLLVVGIVAVLGAQIVAHAQQPAQQNDFVPLKDLPAQAQQEHLPAAPLVMAAYAFVWVALLVYVWSLWRRVGAVQKELTDLRRRAERKA